MDHASTYLKLHFYSELTSLSTGGNREKVVKERSGQDIHDFRATPENNLTVHDCDRNRNKAHTSFNLPLSVSLAVQECDRKKHGIVSFTPPLSATLAVL